MTERPPDADGDTVHHALIGLHVMAGAFDIEPGGVPGLRPLSPGAALRAVAAAPEDEVSISARLAALHELARADFPGYEDHQPEYLLLAASAAGENDMDPDQLLSDLKESAEEGIPFRSTTAGRRFSHSDVAFVGENVCNIRRVTVGGVTATWIFSEFETDAPFDHIAKWVDPRSWPERGPMLFKGMDVVGGKAPIEINSLGKEHWHAVFHEEVQLVQRVNTLLHCDYWRDEQAAGMTYELNFSLDNQLDVDRGFLSVNDLGPTRRVKVLKIVGFTEDVWDDLAQLACPLWTDWIRAAVRGGSTSSPKEPSGEGGSASTPLTEVFDAWLQFYGDSAKDYLELFGDVASRATSGDYSLANWVSDGRHYWSQLAKDWARAWSYGMDVLDDVAKEGLDSSFLPPIPPGSSQPRSAASSRPAPPAGSESTFIPVPALGDGEKPTCSDLVSIEAGGATISANEVTVALETVGGVQGVRLINTSPATAPGLYVGELHGSGGRKIAQVQLYISRATLAPSR